MQHIINDMQLDYEQQRQLQAQAQRAGTGALVVVVRAAADIFKFLWKFIVDMAKGIVGK